jgi:NADP-dependent 3-hydroxy acid dehydrogenase YdfG
MPETTPSDAPVTLITGASAGIGEATAERLAKKGHRLVLTARREDRLREIASRLGEENVAIHAGDVADPATAPKAVGLATQRFGRLDNLVNNAGYGVFATFSELTDEQWREQMEVNLLGCVRFAREALKDMVAQGSGTIVNVSSIAGYNSFPTGAAYCASKHALEGMSGCLRDEVRPLGVRVSLVCPGSVASRFFHESEGHLMGQDRSQEQEWMIRPEQIAEAIAFAVECEAGSFMAKIEVRPLRGSASAKK